MTTKDDLTSLDISVGEKDDQYGIHLGLDKEPFWRVEITPQGLIKTGTGASLPASINTRLDIQEAVQVVSLATPFASTAQEGGATILRGTFTPIGSVAEFDVDLSGYANGWGGATFNFAMGVLPDPAPAVWEGGTKPSLITKCDSLSRTALPGVTEYAWWPLGQWMGGQFLARTRRVIRKTGLTPGRLYQWEARAFGISFFKEHKFPAGWKPKFLAPIPGPESYVMVGCAGTTAATRRVSMVSLGWTVGGNSFGKTPPDMIRHFDFPIAANVTGLRMQQGASSRYCAVMHGGDITIIDTWTPVIVGTYSVGHTLQSIRPDRAGLYFYIGCQTGHVHRFNIASLAFDQQIDLPASDLVVLGGTNEPETHLWAWSYLLKKAYRILLSGPTVGASLVNDYYASEALALKDGRVIGGDTSASDVCRIFAADGTLLRSVSTSGSGVGTLYLAAAPGEQRFMLSIDNAMSAGWAWIDSGQKINQSGFGLVQVFGDIANTDREGTLLCLPNADKVIQWPGGDITIKPDVNDASGGFGASHAEVRVRGAVITGA